MTKMSSTASAEPPSGPSAESRNVALSRKRSNADAPLNPLSSRQPISSITDSMSNQSEKAAEDNVRSWGFGHVFTWTDPPNAYYPPHSHAGLSTHLILRGQLTISYPDDAEPKKETFGLGARVDVDAKRRHEVWMGSEGCTYVIGE